MVFDSYSFSGKERDEETGFVYFGARYYDAELTTTWLSVDPMADKYPSLNPYNYCAGNPVRLVDPEGEEMFPTEADAARVRANAVELFGESRVGEIFDKGDIDHPNYAFHVFGYGKDKSEKPLTNEGGVWAYKPDKCIDSKFDLFLYTTFKAEKEWSLNGSFSIGGQVDIEVVPIKFGVNLSNVDLVGMGMNFSGGNIDFYHCEDNNARGSRGISLGVFTLSGQSYEGGDYIDKSSMKTNILGAGVGKSSGQWNLSFGLAVILGIHANFNSKIKK